MAHKDYRLKNGAPYRARPYLRVSNPREVKDGHGFDYQRKKIPAFCVEQTWGVDHVYEEPGISADSLLYRPTIQEALRDALDHQFDILVGYHENRISRGGPLDWGQLLEVCDETGLILWTMRGGLLYDRDDPSTRPMCIVKGAFAEKDRTDTAIRMREHLIDLAREKKPVMSDVPHGFTMKRFGHVGRDKEILIDPPAAEDMRRIFRMAAEENIGLAKMCQRLHEEGIRSPRGGRWSPSVLWERLRDTAYIGDLVYNRRKVEKKRGKRVVSIRPESEWTHHPVSPVLHLELFHAVQRALDSRAHAGRAAAKHPPGLLNGLVKCSLCGQRYIHEVSVNRSGVYRYYRCGGRKNAAGRRDEYCAGIHPRAEDLEAAVWAEVDKLRKDPERVRRALRDRERQDRKSKPADTAGELKRLEVAKQKMFEAWQAEACSLADFTEQNRLITEKIEAVQARAAGQKKAAEETERQRLSTEAMLAFWKELAERGDDLTPSEKRRALQEAIREVVITPDEMVFHFRVPDLARIIPNMPMFSTIQGNGFTLITALPRAA